MNISRLIAAKIITSAVTRGQGSGAQRLISTRGSLGGVLTTTGKQHMTATKVVICSSVQSVRVAFAGERGSALPSGITVKAAIWKDNSLVGGLTFGGNSSVTVAANTIEISDAIAVSLAAGDTLEIRTYATVASGSGHWGCQFLALNFGDGLEVGATVTDKTLSGTVTAAGGEGALVRGYTPAGVIGLSSRPAVMIFGDSISIGNGDAQEQVGYLGIAFARNRIPYVRVGTGGATGSSGITLTQTDVPIRTMCNYVTDASWQYGVNAFASGSSAALTFATAASWVSDIRALIPTSRLSISTILPVTKTDNSGPQIDAYWDLTKEAQRVAYNNLLRAALPTGFNYLWEAAGDASGASGLFPGLEATKDGGVFRSDFNVDSAVNDGLHPGRPLIGAAASALNVMQFLGVPSLWGPEVAYATIPSSGVYMECVLLPSYYDVAETPGSLTGVASVLSGTPTNAVLMSKVDSDTIRIYNYNRFGLGSFSLAISAGNNLVNSNGSSAPVVTTGTRLITNNSTWVGSSDPGTLLASDDFNRADTAYDAAANNNTIGADWTDRSGNGAKTDTNRLKIQGQNSRIIHRNDANYSDVAAEIEFDPADSTANSSDPFGFKLGVRINPTTGLGVYAGVNRNADLAGYSRLELHFAHTGNAFSTLNNVAVSGNFANGTRYKLRIAVSGTGASKSVVATLSNATTGAGIASLTGTASLATYTDAAGRVGVVTVNTAANDAATPTASEVVLDNLIVRTVADVTAPVFDSASLSSSGRYVDVAITEFGLPLLPTSAAAGFSLSTGAISETIIYGADQVRLVLASTVSLPLTVSYSQAAGNITDQTANELTAFTDETVT